MIEAILWIVGLTLGSWIGVTGWFFAFAHARHLDEDGVRFSNVVKIPLLIYLYAGVALDTIFNVTFGSVVFREVPKEWLFTDRVKRHLTSDDWRQSKARAWAERLNKVDPGHV